jgi:S-adenosylmethionine synthetase
VARSSYLFTSESVSEGHPDKVCDRISDEVVDLFFREAGKSGMDASQVRVACETLATTNRVVIAGEVRTSLDEKAMKSKVKSVARRAIRDIGYEQDGFHWKTAKIDVLLHPQSVDIAQGVDSAGNKDVGAGDQGIMFGYACTETPELMPAPIYYSHKILENLTKLRKAGERGCGKLGPDAKSQVTIRYENGRPTAVTQIVLSTQHLDASMSSADVRKLVEPIIRETLADIAIDKDCKWWINPTGKFLIGGPDGDSGLTGRKIIVDTYGGAAPTAAVRSPARIPPRSTARQPMPPAIWPRTSWPPSSPTAARSSCPMPLAWPSRCRSMSTPMAPARLPMTGSKLPWPRSWT